MSHRRAGLYFHRIPARRPSGASRAASRASARAAPRDRPGHGPAGIRSCQAPGAEGLAAADRSGDPGDRAARLGSPQMRIAALFLGLLLITMPARANINPASFGSLSFHQHPGAQLPLDAVLTDAAGHPSTLGAAILGRPSLVILEYLRCQNLCSLVLSGAVKAISDARLVPG